MSFMSYDMLLLFMWGLSGDQHKPYKPCSLLLPVAPCLFVFHHLERCAFSSPVYSGATPSEQPAGPRAHLFLCLHLLHWPCPLFIQSCHSVLQLVPVPRPSLPATTPQWGDPGWALQIRWALLPGHPPPCRDLKLLTGESSCQSKKQTETPPGAVRCTSRLTGRNAFTWVLL